MNYNATINWRWVDTANFLQRLLIKIARTTASPIILIVCAIPSCLAQYSVPIQHTISTPYGNVNQTSRIMVGGQTYGTLGNISKKYNFSVVMQNDSSFSVKTRIEITGKKHILRVKGNKQVVEITPALTKEISRTPKDGSAKMVGIPSDSCWLFPGVQGKISGYSFLAEANSPYLVAIRKYDGPIVKLTEDALRDMLEGNEKALKYVEKKNFKKAIDTFNHRP